MAKPVACRIADMPDGRFAVVAVLSSGRVFRREGLLTLAEAEACAEGLRNIMAACGATVITGGDRPGQGLANVRFLSGVRLGPRA